MHGDTLCTDDLEYQRFRAMVRDPPGSAISSPAPGRAPGQHRSTCASGASRQERKTDEIMDVAPAWWRPPSAITASAA